MLNVTYYFLIFSFLISYIHGECLQFSENRENGIKNKCETRRANRSNMPMCLNCFINRPMLPLENIIIDEKCLPYAELQCVELHFNNTESFFKFPSQYINIINKLFDENMTNKTLLGNVLFINIQNDSLDELALETIQSFDNISNRNYRDLRLILRNRGNRTILKLNPNLQNTTFAVLQAYIHCSNKYGWYVYDYIRGELNNHLREYIKCELPPPLTTVTQLVMSTSFSATETAGVHNSSNSTILTRRNRSKLILISSLAIGACLLPCLLMACCLYILCRRDNEENTRRFSITDSLSNNESVTSSKSTKSLI